MKKMNWQPTCETDYFTAEQHGPVVVFSPLGNQLLASTMLRAKEMVHSYLAYLDRHPEVRIVLILHPPRRARREEFLSLFDMVRSARIPAESVLRLYRAIDQLILRVLDSDLFFISADCGQILPMFAAISLACDYRILGENAVFQNPELELGLIPKGGSAWFLSRILGRGKTIEMLLSRKSISVKEALALGLANRCIAMDNFEEEALAIARELANLPETSLVMAKRLTSRMEKSLPEFLEFENRELMRAMQKLQMTS